ncbi:MAG TPA: bifunctional phosphopantothenoylcysteine decarboxylase/phosphopantothenate--cysteine ligase CoaBC [Flavobacteriaceae bacterium]|jgi:phosphopantothenoylcysteine decarboxylase / phosphopantothenate---cysteine ligase|nr:bifunctional phosphopantothenoylcysteine decarboxylase/phosphopantothenate--cysteine ligase CoaBC [Flavobacteriaceae bacterium]
MGLLSGKKILLGISGGIAAYKTPFLVRQIVQHGAEVKVVMTPSAKDFVTPLTLATLSKNPVLSTFTATDLDNPVWNDHVELALWADLMLIAPATSNTLSSMVQGRCNNLLLAVYLSSKCPVFVAPAMDLDMYSHPSNKRNLEALVSYGTNVLPVGEGFLASGLEGKGRMMEPEEIVSKIVDFFNPSLPLKGKKVLITAGPTYEAIDPVRFIGNHASGKMGFALAEVAAQHGAEVILISGPTHEKINHPSILLEKVISAEEMFTSVKKHYPQVAIAIAAAAVADFKPKNSAKQKIKKQQGLESIPMIPTVDILAYMGEHKSGQFLLGFALETENELENAKNKLTQKNLDGIVLNSLRDPESGFTVSTNKITYIDANSTVKEFPLQSKLDCAKTIFGQILKP